MENRLNNIYNSAIKIISEFEGLRLEAYPDSISGWGLPTIGYGNTIYPDGKPIKKGDRITKEQAEKMLENHIINKIIPVLSGSIPTWSEMNANQRSALISFAYNLGASFFRKRNFESITRVCESVGRWDDEKWVKEQFIKYCNPYDHAVTNGLKRRRTAEAELFCEKV